VVPALVGFCLLLADKEGVMGKKRGV
jgi:hypothetical protein